MADMAMGVCQTGDHPKTRQCQGSSSSRNLGTHPDTLASRIGFKHLVGKAAAGRALAKTHTRPTRAESWTCGRVCVCAWSCAGGRLWSAFLILAGIVARPCLAVPTRRPWSGDPGAGPGTVGPKTGLVPVTLEAKRKGTRARVLGCISAKI